jgi:hypothetical protein
VTTPDEPATGSVGQGAGPSPTPVPPLATPEAPQAPQAPQQFPQTNVESAELRKTRAALKKLQGEYDTLKQQGMTEAEQAIAKARAEGAAEYQNRWRSTVLANEVLKLLAAKNVQGAELVLGALDLSDVEVDANGRVDAAILGQRIDDILTRYPMLAAGTTPTLPTATGAGQTRVSTQQLVGLNPDDKTKRNEYLRWALQRDG